MFQKKQKNTLQKLIYINKIIFRFTTTPNLILFAIPAKTAVLGGFRGLVHSYCTRRCKIDSAQHSKSSKTIYLASMNPKNYARMHEKANLSKTHVFARNPVLVWWISSGGAQNLGRPTGRSTTDNSHQNDRPLK